ncbi:hypothetical protein B0H19DRAFT_1351854 [Mycena capillaripes]|nr:hypothetical protein B0H19DRAFT_1351854 [Mycena capillaripes]
MFSSSDLPSSRTKACTNCRSATVPGQSAINVAFVPQDHIPHSQETPAQMLDTIRSLKQRIEELELLVDSDPSRVYLRHPYVIGDRIDHTQSSIEYGSSTPINLLEPSPDAIANLTDIFLAQFGGSGYFFLDPYDFRHSVLLPLPFGHQDRPSPALLSVVYLWGSVLSHATPNHPHTPDAFLTCVLQNIPRDLTGLDMNRKLILDTLQAEVMLSLYLMHVADLVHGRYHCAAASSLALSAGLHLTGSPKCSEILPPFPMRTAPAADAGNDASVLWAVFILNSSWLVVDGVSSSISWGILFDTPWDPSSQVKEPFSVSKSLGALQNFLDGAVIEGLTSVVLLAKAGVLLERVISFVSFPGSLDTLIFASVERQLLDFQESLLQLHNEPNLTLARAFTDLAIVRLHAPYSDTSERSLHQALAASARIVRSTAGLNTINGSHINPVFGPIYWTIANFYISAITLAHQRSQATDIALNVNVHQLEASLTQLLSELTSLAPYSHMFRTPILPFNYFTITHFAVSERCFVDVRMAYDNLLR